MAYPDPLATDKADATTTPTDHPTHHNDLASYVNENVDRLAATNPQVTMLRNQTASINDTSVTAVPFTSELRDDGGWHDNSTNNTRVTVPADGDYRVSISSVWDTNTTGDRLIYARLNGSSTLVGQQSANGATGNKRQSASQVVPLSATNYVEAIAYQTSGGARSVDIRLTVELVPAAQ